jgi:hypothetical protein
MTERVRVLEEQSLPRKSSYWSNESSGREHVGIHDTSRVSFNNGRMPD